MFPEAENEMRTLLNNYATGGRVGANIGGIMGGRVGLKVLRDYFEDEEEEAAQGGRIGYAAGTEDKKIDLSFYLDEPAKGFGEVLAEDAKKRRKKFKEKYDKLIESLKKKFKYAQGGRIGAQEGGLMDLGVWKKIIDKKVVSYLLVDKNEQMMYQQD